MSSIDLFEDFNEEQDALAGDNDDFDREDDNRSENNERENEGDQEDGEKVEPKVKIVKVRRKLVTLNVERLKGPRGIIAIDDFYKNMKFKGRGHEKQDLDEVMLRLQHWAHRMFPKYNFDDSLAAIERLGKKRELQVHMQRYRLDQLTKDDDDRQIEDLDNEMQPREGEDFVDQPMDEFEKMLDEQIALTRTTNVDKSSTMDKSFGNISSISGIEPNKTQSTQNSHLLASNESQYQKGPEPSQASMQISDETRARIAENRLKAMEIRERKRQEAEASEKLENMKSQTHQEISNMIIDDDDF